MNKKLHEELRSIGVDPDFMARDVKAVATVENARIPRSHLKLVEATTAPTTAPRPLAQRPKVKPVSEAFSRQIFEAANIRRAQGRAMVETMSRTWRKSKAGKKYNEVYCDGSTDRRLNMESIQTGARLGTLLERIDQVSATRAKPCNEECKRKGEAMSESLVMAGTVAAILSDRYSEAGLKEDASSLLKLSDAATDLSDKIDMGAMHPDDAEEPATKIVKAAGDAYEDSCKEDFVGRHKRVRTESIKKRFAEIVRRPSRR